MRFINDIVLVLLLFFPYLSLSSDYTCKADSGMSGLSELYSLNKDSNGSIYKVCKGITKKPGIVVLIPSNVGILHKDLLQSLMNNSLNMIQQAGSDVSSCQPNNISKLTNFLSSAQKNICNMEVRNCKMSCEGKLREVKQTFRECFSLKPSHSIEAVLQKAQTQQTDQSCWRHIRDVAEKYRQQSLSGGALLKDHLKSVDVVNCGSITGEVNQKNLNTFCSKCLSTGTTAAKKTKGKTKRTRKRL